MSKKETSAKVLQFPGGKAKDAPKQAEKPVVHEHTHPPLLPRGKANMIVGATVLAVALATGAVNRYIFNSSESMDMSSSSRAIASVEGISWDRDASWEKRLAESLASPQVRELASQHIGRPASIHEKLRWGTLQEKYTIVYGEGQNHISQISFQDHSSHPSYVLDRAKFLKEYGTLLGPDFQSAALKTVSSVENGIIESYVIYDKDQRPTGEVKFELDRYKRLLSLKVEPVNL